MDPLSISASILTIGAALNGARKCIQRLRSARPCGTELAELTEDVIDFASTLAQVHGLLQKFTTALESELPAGTIATLKRQAERATIKLEQLTKMLPEADTLNQHRSGLRIRNYDWLSTRKKTVTIHQQIRSIQLQMIVVLSSIQA